MSLRKERVTAQHKSAKGVVDTQAACEVEEKEPKRKTAIKEKERASSEMTEKKTRAVLSSGIIVRG
jgi:hypothetical protein